MTRIEMRVDGRRKPGNLLENVLEVDRKTQEGGRRQRETSNYSRKTRCPNETVESWEGSELRDGRREK